MHAGPEPMLEKTGRSALDCGLVRNTTADVPNHTELY